MPIYLPELSADPAAPFPDPRSALRDPDGLLAMGGDLSPDRLLTAYASGIFPWYSEGQPLLWWSPDPRTVFRTNAVHLSRRFRRDLRRSTWTITADTTFRQVIDACAQSPRADQPGTWITPSMCEAYDTLHELGYGHSIEVWDGATLAGGLYGVAIGRMFFGESMFSAATGGSKIALAALAHHLDLRGWPLIDAQVENAHLMSLGAMSWPRDRFLDVAGTLAGEPGEPGNWSERFGVVPAWCLAVETGRASVVEGETGRTT
ncbi:leucyl/phenylalanyl-tRNA--protein transferase [Lysobacter sp. A03]|uniref:leucyl/phenylalanyl-tRNA--protein transferase n=1 Tax=Lysobacter sp. A03 TaxID=1199154 RepID=UPI0005B74400|nr:leucyl/phenylalanyl-tRNA--protein transferase [Lysobacter sp. A03]KIQ96571.1 Leucyl/phenylalanyl-tRNA--protein transferase [Lysobacter sp. A03]